MSQRIFLVKITAGILKTKTSSQFSSEVLKSEKVEIISVIPSVNQWCHLKDDILQTLDLKILM